MNGGGDGDGTTQHGIALIHTQTHNTTLKIIFWIGIISLLGVYLQ